MGRKGGLPHVHVGVAASWFFHEIARAFCASFFLALADRGERYERAVRVMSPPILLLLAFGYFHNRMAGRMA
jgi:hypothetical protein